MKILYFLGHPDSVGGAVRVLMIQAYIMQSQGHQVKIVVQNDEQDSHIPEYEKLLNKMELSYISTQYPIATCIEEIDICKCMDSFDYIKSIVVNCSPDIIHSIQLNTTVELVSRELNIPHIMNIYQISDGMFNIDWLKFFPQYHSCDSEFYSKQWAKGLGIESKCIRVAYEKPDALIKKVNDAQLRYELINMAVFVEHKRQLEIIKFVEYCKNQGMKLHINFLGNNEYPYGVKCKEYVQAHQLENEVSFVGLVLNVEEYLSKSELMIHASTAESYPGVIVEAMANKVCVLATPVAGIPELVINEKNGFLTKGYTYQDIYKCFECYIKCKENNQIKQIVDNAYQTYLENHTYEQISKQLDEYYKYIIKNYYNQKANFLNKDDVQQMLQSFIGECKLKQISQNNMRKVWFLYHINEIVKEKQYKTALIWGAGMNATTALEWCTILELDVLAFIDTYKQGRIDKYKIYHPSDYDINSADVVFVSIGNIAICEEVIYILEKQGRIRNKDYFLLFNNPCIAVKNSKDITI